MEDSARTVSESIKKTLSCLPDNAAVDQAIERIRAIQISSRSNSVSPIFGVDDMRQVAAKLIEANSEVVISARTPKHSESVKIFVDAYEIFHSFALRVIKKTIMDVQRRELALESLEMAHSQALNVLNRAHSAHIDPNNLAHTQALAQASRSLTDSINIIVEQVTFLHIVLKNFGYYLAL